MSTIEKLYDKPPGGPRMGRPPNECLHCKSKNQRIHQLEKTIAKGHRQYEWTSGALARCIRLKNRTLWQKLTDWY